MPVQKFRSFEEARDALWSEPGTTEHSKRMAWVWSFARRLSPPSFPRGVYRHASIEDANRQREEWERTRAQRRASS